MRFFLLLVLMLLPVSYARAEFSLEADQPITECQPITHNDVKIIMGISSLLIGPLIIFAGTHMTYDQGNMFCFALGGTAVIHGTTCLLEF